MAAQETYQIKETASTVLQETVWRPLKATNDIAVVRSQSDRLLDLFYKDAERGAQYDLVNVKRYVVYLAPADIQFLEDGKRIGEFSRRDMAEMVCDALNAKPADATKIRPTTAEELSARIAKHHASTTAQSQMNEIAAEKLKNLRPQI